jgi:hypothetical protein
MIKISTSDFTFVFIVSTSIASILTSSRISSRFTRYVEWLMLEGPLATPQPEQLHCSVSEGRKMQFFLIVFRVLVAA